MPLGALSSAVIVADMDTRAILNVKVGVRENSLHADRQTNVD